MNLKWRFLILFVILYLFGMFGIGWNTFATTDVSKADPLIETVKIVFIMLGGLGVLLPTYLNIWQSIEAANLQEDNYRRVIIDNTFALLEKWDGDALLEARKFTRELLEQENALSPNEILNRIQGNPDLKQSVILLFNYWELVRISVEHNRVNPKIIKEILGVVLQKIFTLFKPWIDTFPPAYRDDLKKLNDLLSRIP